MPLNNSVYHQLFQEPLALKVTEDGILNQRPLPGLRIYSKYYYDAQEIWPNHELLPKVRKQSNTCGKNQIDSHQEDCVGQEQQQVGNG